MDKTTANPANSLTDTARSITKMPTGGSLLRDSVRFPVEGVDGGSISMLSVQIG